MKKYKLVFKEPTVDLVQVFFVDEYIDDDGFISFIDEKTSRKVIYNKTFLVKIVGEVQ